MTTPAFADGTPARAIVDLDAIRDNVRALRGHAPSADLMAVVKADGYGHGMLPAARAALAGGATWLGVATAEEAIALRAGLDTDVRVLVWLLVPGAPFAELITADVDVTVAAPWALEEVAAGARAAGRTARVHVKVDTGLSRNGVAMRDLPAVVRRAAELEASGELRVVGVFSHLACADEPGHPSIDRQGAAFDGALAQVARAGLRPEVRHLANSAATLTRPDLHHDLVRPGISVYGNSPGPGVGPPGRFGLRPAMTLESRLANVKQVAAGEGVSYGHTYTTTQDTTVGLVPLGYGDGVPRHGSGGAGSPGAPVAVGDGATARVLRVAGRVCMDQFVLDLGPGATERAGDLVTLFGASDGVAHGSPLPNAQDWAEAAGTISYEIVTRLAPRVPRVYVPAAGTGAIGTPAPAPTGDDPEGERQSRE
ncbi:MULTISPECIES: alanine racemase [unclassified Isoptericola]|uniref:alanine racemase n=1 Tax=unclassified Isoptericola TaxID=2623355 RepID=UPI0027128279|nr:MULTISPECIES: alanine racemase [unclassified Isoptericola]MDO8143136.1 alanine racemase [Isoptericola sp. 178]MDO8150688.1 alanine racemase [Isoptericola sp. b408]